MIAKLKTILVALALSVLFFILKTIAETIMLFVVVAPITDIFLDSAKFTPGVMSYVIEFMMFGILINFVSLTMYAVLGYKLKAYFHEDSLLELCMRVIMVTTLLFSFFSLHYLYSSGVWSIWLLAIWYIVPVMSLYAGYRLSIKKREVAQ